VLGWGFEPPDWGKGWLWRLEIGSLSSAVTTSYRLSTLTIGLLLTVFTELRLITDRQTEFGLAKGTMH